MNRPGWAVGLAAVLTLCAVTPALASLTAPAPPAEKRELASGTAGTFRLTVTATMKPSNDGMPTATLTAAGFQLRDGTWTPIGRLPVPGQEAWFWNVVTDLGGVCEFSVGDTPRPTAIVGINGGQALGCAPIAKFHVEDGKLVAG